MKYLINGQDLENASNRRILLDAKNVLTIKQRSADANGYAYVDLGLPSGTLWAECNVCSTDPYSNQGKLFQWGDPTPYDVPQCDEYNIVLDGEKDFAYNDYKWCTSDPVYGYQYTKYSSKDKKLIMDLEDDPAHVNMGGDWRMPMMEDVMELLNNTTQELYAMYRGEIRAIAYMDYSSENRFEYDGHTPTTEPFYLKFISKINGNFLIVPFTPQVQLGMLVERDVQFQVIDLIDKGEEELYLQFVGAGIWNDEPHNFYTHAIPTKCGGTCMRGVLKKP